MASAQDSGVFGVGDAHDAYYPGIGTKKPPWPPSQVPLWALIATDQLGPFVLPPPVTGTSR